MDVTTMCCTLNEERNIERYCEVYSRFSDRIVICDGGSTDNTVALAEGFEKVEVIHFPEIVEFEGIPWNPKGTQHNFAYEAVLKRKPDWIITDECDSIPTIHLQTSIRAMLQMAVNDVIGVHRLYIMGEESFFATLSLKGHFGWAHRPRRANGKYGGDMMKGLRRPNLPKPDVWRNLGIPFGLLHYGWPDEETIAFKTKRYRATGGLPPQGTAVPSNAGTPEPLPEWATWN